MTTCNVEITDEELDKLTLEGLLFHSKCVNDYTSDKKLIKAFKRVIEYYGGSVE